jgi:putative CocE/NonD family hydrolase
VATVGGQTFLPGVQQGRNSGPKDQVGLESRPDVLVHRSELLDSSVTVAGSVTLELWATSSAEDCDWTARLVDVDLDGRSRGVADGILRARYRTGTVPTPLVPGRPERFRIEIGTVAHRFETGHRIGLQVASSNFPRFDRNPQCLMDPARATAEDFVVAEQTVFHGGAMPSRLLLPVPEET